MAIPGYVRRSLESVIEQAAVEFPAVVVTGPRQSGKTTLLRHLFGESHRYVSVEPPDVRDAAMADPRGFLERYPPPVVIDEVHFASDLLQYIKERIDGDRGARGQFVLTGSQNLLLLERVPETLAGRAAILKLMPLTRRELEGEPERPLAWSASSARAGSARWCHGTLWEQLLRGWYPEVNVETDRDAALWQSSYVQTYLERDVRSLRQVGDLGQFRAFLRALAARCSQLLNLSEIARDLGISVNTAKAWLSVLEATQQVLIVRPYFANVTKRLVKTPKIYFADVGLVCHLVGLRDAEHVAHGPMAGALFENAVVAEVYKSLVHFGAEPILYFWRTSTGAEVDLLVDDGGSLVPIEVKTSSTPRPQMARSIATLRDDLGDRVGPGLVVHPGDQRLPLGRGITAIPFAEL